MSRYWNRYLRPRHRSHRRWELGLGSVKGLGSAPESEWELGSDL